MSKQKPVNRFVLYAIIVVGVVVGVYGGTRYNKYLNDKSDEQIRKIQEINLSTFPLRDSEP